MEDHHSFLSSPLKTEILGPQEDTLDFVWGIHVPMTAAIEEAVPLDAPVLAIARLVTKSEGGGKAGDVGALEEYRELTVGATGSSTWTVFGGWRCDAEEGKQEAVLISGWESEARCDAFKRRMSEENEKYEGVSVVLAKDMEA